MARTSGRCGSSESASRQGNADLPAAVVLGADPGTTIAAVAPKARKTIRIRIFRPCAAEKKLSLVKCKTVPLSVPAEAEIVLEGTLV